MDKISEALSKIMEDPNLQQELAKKETIEDIYDFCISISDGYTMEEFQSYLKDLIKMVNGMPEEKLEQVSGGTKWNNKALSAVLATMSLASPLAGAAGSVQETTDQSQPSAISSFAGKVNKAVKDNPITSALAGLNVAGLGLLALLTGHSKSEQPQQQPQQQQDQNNANQQPQQQPNQNNVNPQNGGNQQQIPQQPAPAPNILSGISNSLPNYNEIVNQFNGLGERYKVLAPGEIAHTCETGTRNYPIVHAHTQRVKEILYHIDRNINTVKTNMISFDRYLPTDPVAALNSGFKHIDDKDVLEINTTDIASLDNIRIRSSESKTGLTTYTVINLDNYQKAIVIRYVQAKYAQEKRFLR